MKKILLLVALTAMSVTANASKARQAALGGARTVTRDVQDTFTNPANMFAFGDQLSIEFDTAAADSAEGGIFRSNGDTKYGIYYGHRSPGFAEVISAANNPTGTLNTGTFLTEQNPIELFYGSKAGDMKWGASFIYSAAEDKSPTASGKKTNTMGIRAGAVTDVWEAYINFGLAANADSAAGAAKIKQDLGLVLGGQYAAGEVLYYGMYDTRSGKLTTTSDVKASKNTITLGAESKLKGDTAHFFYGAKYVTVTSKPDDTTGAKVETSDLPLYAGVEAEAASWLVLRASLSQSFLINSSKTSSNAGTTAENTGFNDTTAALGAGLKFGKLMVDGTLQAGNTGNLDTAAGMIANASLNYTF